MHSYPQQASLVTLGVQDLERSRRFYRDGFGWSPLLTDKDTTLYKMNGYLLSLWLETELLADLQLAELVRPAAFTLAHCMTSEQAVHNLMGQLLSAGGSLLRAVSRPVHGGCRGYIADPDGHIWELLWNPAWTVDEDGGVSLTPPSP